MSASAVDAVFPADCRSGTGIQVVRDGASWRFDLAAGGLGNGVMSAMPALTLKGRLGEAGAPQDLPLSSLVGPGNPVGDAFAAQAAALAAKFDAVTPITAWTLNGSATAAFVGPDIGPRMGFGAGFRGGQVLHSLGADRHYLDGLGVPQADARATFSVTRQTSGSGANGPGNADYAAMLGTTKANYLTSLARGEIDGLFVSVKQGARDDAGGILIDARKVHLLDGNDTGGTVALETTTAKIDNLGNLRQSIQTIIGYGEGNGGPSSGTGYGAYAEAQVGTPYAAYYAGNLSPGAWQWAFALHASRSPATRLAGIDGAGRARMSVGSAPLPGYAFEGDADTGLFRPGADALGIATGGVARLVVDAAGHQFPGADGTYSSGTSTNRWNVLYAASSTINTSDARLKLDVRPTPLGLDFVRALDPVAFRYADGGTRMADRWVEEEREEVELDAHGQPVVDMVPQFEADGTTPVWDTAGETVAGPDGAPLLGPSGEPIVRRRQRVVAVPRTLMATVRVNRPERVEAPGTRTHLGFLAQDVRAALVAAGMPDAAMWTLDDPSDPTSRQGLRETHLIAPLVRAVQEQAETIEALERRLTALEARG